MAKVILICGKICSGKTTYAHHLRRMRRAALLSMDEVMLSLLGQHTGDMHDTYAARTEEYLLHKALELLESDVDVILDWGFWRREKRVALREFFTSRGISCEFHGIDIDDQTWHARLAKRNAAVEAGEVQAYYVDDNLAAKFASRYEAPSEDEIDVWIPS